MKINKTFLIAIISCISFLGIILFSFYDVTVNGWDNIYKAEKAHCENPEYADEEFCINYKDGEKAKTTLDTFAIFSATLTNYKFVWINCIAIIFVVLPCLYDFCKMLKSKMIINYFNRDSYQRVLKRNFLSCLKYSWIIIIPLLVLFICSYLYSGHFDYSYGMKFGYTGIYSRFNPIAYIILYFVCIYLFTLFFINLAIIISRKNHNIIVVLIETFLVYLAIDMVIEVGVGSLLLGIITGKRRLGFLYIR